MSPSALLTSPADPPTSFKFITASHPEESQPRTHFHITGFSQFRNVPVNPTELLIRALPDHLSRHQLSPSSTLVSADVLPVSAHTSRAHLNILYDALPSITSPVHCSPLLSRSPQPHNVFIHFGVDVGCTNFTLECQARNEATFSCPDQDGWLPLRTTIDPDDDDITATRRTSLDLHSLQHHLTLNGFPVDISSDAGRFVCNWTYFNSLKLAKTHYSHALFVHVPPASVIPIKHQVHFAAQLLHSVSQLF